MLFLLVIGRPPRSTRTAHPFPIPTLCRSLGERSVDGLVAAIAYLECQVGVFKVSRNVFLAETADSAPQFQGQHHARAGQIVGLTGVVEAWIVGVGIAAVVPRVAGVPDDAAGLLKPARSEEHTSELQSLM